MTELSKTILLVEDNPDDVFVMKRALKKAQITNLLQVVRDGREALSYLSGAGDHADRERYPLPFIVFLDLKLPYLHGFEVLRWIRQQPSLDASLVIVLTSSAESKDNERAYALGARSYLVKPPTPEALRAVMDSLKNYWLSFYHSTPVSIGV